MRWCISRYVLLLAILGVFLIESCTRDCPSPPELGPVTGVIPWHIPYLLPYKDNDSIQLIENSADTLVFYTSRVESSYNTGYLSHEPCPRREQLRQLTQSLTTNSGD